MIDDCEAADRLVLMVSAPTSHCVDLQGLVQNALLVELEGHGRNEIVSTLSVSDSEVAAPGIAPTSTAAFLLWLRPAVSLAM